MRIVDRRVTDRQRARRGVDDRLRTHLARIERGGDGERLQRRPGLERVDQRAIAHVVARGPLAIVRVERRPVRQRQNLAGLGVEHDQRAGPRLVRLDRGLELAKGQVLQPAVDRQREIAAFLRRAYARHVLDDLAAAIDDHAPAARVAAQPALLRELDAFLTDVAVAGEADDLAHHFAAGVIAPVLVFVVNAVDLQRGDVRGRLRRNRFFQVDEVAALRELLFERGGRHVQRRGERLQLVRRRVDLIGPRPYRLDRRADRERIAEAVDDAAAMRRHLDVAAVARAALLLQEAVVDALQIERATEQSGKQQKQAAEDQRRAQAAAAAARPAHCVLNVCANLIAAPLRRLRRRAGAGNCMRNCSRAIFSTRAGIAQVDCSICSCPYSTS